MRCRHLQSSICCSVRIHCVPLISISKQSCLQLDQSDPSYLLCSLSSLENIYTVWHCWEMPFAVPLWSSQSKAEKRCVPLYISLRRSIIHFSPCNLAVSFSDCGNTDHRWRNYMLSIYKCCLQTLWSNKSPRLSIWNCWSEPREQRCSQMTHTPGKMSLPQLHCIETSQPQSHNSNHQTQHKKEI